MGARLNTERPRRNLDELRRVEKETKEAMDREQQLRAARKSEPIRTRSDIVRIDNLEDEMSDGADDVANMDFTLEPTSEGDPASSETVHIDGLDDVEDGKVQEQARKTLEALQEFDRLA